MDQTMEKENHWPADDETRRARYRAAAKMLREWMNVEDDYDERVWPELEKSLTDARLKCR